MVQYTKIKTDGTIEQVNFELKYILNCQHFEKQNV